MASILSGSTFKTSEYVYTKAKVQANGRKQVGILNSDSKKSLYLSTPLMLTWGINTYEDENTGRKTYDMALQFPNDEYNNPTCVEFLKNMQAFETKVKEDAIVNSKDWLNKTKLVPEAVDALWSPMLKYPKDKESGDSDYSRPPTLKVKIPCWEGEFKNVEIYDDKSTLLFPTSETDTNIEEFIVKATNVATIIQCGGIWVANGKFGVTWKLFQAVVKPKTVLSGKCHIVLSSEDKEKMSSSKDDDDDDDDAVMSEDNVNLTDHATSKLSTTQIQDSDNEDTDTVTDAKQEVASLIDSVKPVGVEEVKKAKKVVKKKALVASSN